MQYEGIEKHLPSKPNIQICQTYTCNVLHQSFQFIDSLGHRFISLVHQSEGSITVHVTVCFAICSIQRPLLGECKVNLEYCDGQACYQIQIMIVCPLKRLVPPLFHRIKSERWCLKTMHFAVTVVNQLTTGNPHTATERQQHSEQRSLFSNIVDAKAKLNILRRVLISDLLLSYMSVPFRVIPVFKKSFATLLHTASRFTKW